MPLTLPEIPTIDLNFLSKPPSAPAPVGVKDDAGKLRHALVDLAAHNEMVAVLTHGAEKYSRMAPCTCGAASAGNQPGPEGFAEDATRRISSDVTPSTPTGSEPTQKRGAKRTRSEQPSIDEHGTRRSAPIPPQFGDDDRDTIGSSTESHSSRPSGSSVADARYADHSSDSESITRTRTERSADASVTRATSGSDSSSVPVVGLSVHSPTCKAGTWIDGAGNWRHVKDWEDRYFESTIRHLIADRQGEHVDKDTGGLLALACAACGVHFLLAMRLAQHPELRDSLERRLKASVAKARTLKNEREAAKRRAERELATTLSGVEQRRPEDIGVDAMTDDELRARVAELTAEIERLDRSGTSRRKRPRAVTTSRKGDRRTRAR